MSCIQFIIIISSDSASTSASISRAYIRSTSTAVWMYDGMMWHANTASTEDMTTHHTNILTAKPSNNRWVQNEQIVFANKTAHTTFYDTSALGNATPAPRGGRGAGPHKTSHRRHAESHYKFGVIVCPYKWYRKMLTKLDCHIVIDNNFRISRNNNLSINTYHIRINAYRSTFANHTGRPTQVHMQGHPNFERAKR